MANNVKSCKKFDEKAQTAKFTVFAREIRSAVLKTWKTRKTKTRKFSINMSQLLLFQKVESGGGPIFKVVFKS